jgi:dUTP pyrophosphatase
VRRGDRVAQLVVAPVSRVRWNETATLPRSARGAGGFGSTDAPARDLAGQGS